MVANSRKRKSRGADQTVQENIAVEPVNANAEPAFQSTEELITETRKILASLDPQASVYHPRHRPEDHVLDDQKPDSKNEVVKSALSLAAFKVELLSKSGEAIAKEHRRRSSGGPSGSTTARNGDGQQVDASSIDWQMYRDWPEGVAAEEEAMRSYFSRLKFLYLERATKLAFLTSTAGDGIVYSEAELQAREEATAKAKAELKAAKSRMRDLRAEIDNIADGLFEPVAQLEAQQTEAKSLISSIKDMELELAKIRATTGSSRIAYDVKSTVPPKFGTMTLEEAEAFNELQLEEMQVLQEGTTQAQQVAKAKQKELANTMRAVERLNVERKREEKYAEEVGKDGGRDLEVEQMCEERVEKLNLLKGTLGVESIDALSETELCIQFVSSDRAAPSSKRSRRSAAAAANMEYVKLLLEYEACGGRLQTYSIVRPDNTDVELPEEHIPLIDAAFRANDAPALIQELWRAMEAQ